MVLGVQMDEKLEFKVIEFSKSAKRIILSHSRVYEDVKKTEETAKKKATTKQTQKEHGKLLRITLKKLPLEISVNWLLLRTQMEEKEKKE